MTEDIIRKAVGLAEGWFIDGVWLCYGDAGAAFHDAEHPIDKPLPNYIKDALAAQLVRQCNKCFPDRYAFRYHDDPMVNIEYIVESEVLDQLQEREA